MEKHGRGGAVCYPAILWNHGTFDLSQKRSQGQSQSSYFSEGTPITKFSRRGGMGIGSDHDAMIVQNAVTLECHSIAEKAFLLYRGTDFPTDLPYSPQNLNQPYSFSQIQQQPGSSNSHEKVTV